MIFRVIKILSFIFFSVFFVLKPSFSEIIKNIEIKGNYRIPTETVVMFSGVSSGEKIDVNNLNEILKNIYDSNFFSNVSVILKENSLIIEVEELPIIENIIYEGIKAKKIQDKVFKDLTLKSRSSYNEIYLNQDRKKIESALRDLGYFFSTLEISVIELDDNKINLKYNVDLGSKSKIKKISFVGDKIYKDRKLKRIIASEEYKFWKFISGKKYLNENLLNFDERLLKNFYLNKGYYDVKINSSFAKLIENEEFELIFNINAGEKFFFDKLSLSLPNDFEKDNFQSLFELFDDLKDERYSINTVDEILEKIDQITLAEQYQSISATVEENIEKNKINLQFNINKSKDLYIQKINIFGNNITQENVIRNQLEIDEGDPYNEILANKSINNLKSLNFFKTVDSTMIDGNSDQLKIININVEEKPTGEISAGAGIGTNGGSLMLSVKENNYLGRGLGLNTNVFLNAESITGIFSVNNPNYKNTDKSAFIEFRASETDRLTNFGYKTNKNGFSVGTGFEFYDDLRFGLSTSNFYEKIETNSTASARQKSQQGDYWDSFISLSFDHDKRNQKFQTSDGFRNRYLVDIPIISKTNTLTNTYNYQFYTELYENNLTNFSLYLKSANSLSNDDVKLSERIFIPSNKLRGFENGRIGPKDGNDFIGGNYATALNFSSTIPQFLENSQNVDLLFFIDAANLWGVDYDSSIDDNSKIRSSLGFGIDWLTPIGPMNFTIAEPLLKADTDITETFRFNLGTTF